VTGYEYGNTRLRAMRSRLLGPADLSEMIGAGSLDRMLTMLADTPYAPDLEAALVRGRGLPRLDEAIRSNLARTLRRMASFYEGEAREKVDLLLLRWDLRNLRTLIRLPEVPVRTEEDVALLVPAGRLGEAELTELAAQPDVASRIDLMVAWGVPSRDTAITLLAGRAAYLTEGDSSQLEAALDRAFAVDMQQVLGQERTGAASILRAEIDARNLDVALRRREARIEREPGWSDSGQAYVPGGTLTAETWTEVAATDSPETVATILAGKNPVPGWDEVIHAWVSHADVRDLTDRMRRAITSAAVSRFVTGDPLGFDIPLAFTFAKEAEARNLHLVGRGIVHGIPVAELERRLESAA
jgi:V/A-type H+/Na+-transporting ATPase subunit C